MTHDPMCGFNRDSGEFDFMADSCARCEFIAKVRADEAPKAVTRWIEQGASSDDWMKVWQVRDYAEELEAKVRADTLDSAVQRVEENVLIGMTLTPKEVRMVIAAIRGES